MTLTPTPVSLRNRPRFDAAELGRLDASFSDATPFDVIEWAVETFGRRLVLTASFADTLLIDLATRVDPTIEVVFLDTGFHFPETLATVRRAMARYELNLTVLTPDAGAPDVWSHGNEACCGARKVAALERHLTASADAWLSGLRRDDGADRATTPTVGLDRRGLVKVNPLTRWSTAELDRHVLEHDVLVNPLAFEGYPSIGCWPCTEPASGDDQRAGRWAGSAKTECGLHV